ncbi:MAG: NUDIX domain-containing protein [Thermoanaerobaculia bacterium]
MYARPLYCSQCGTRLEERSVGAADGKTVPVCPACGAVHWIDPKVAAGCLVVRDGRVLLLRRAIEPGYGQWVFPGGHVDRGETLEAAALRETHEECGALARIEGLLGIYSYPGRPVIVAAFRATLLPESPEPYAADETLEIGWFAPEEIDGVDLAFRSSADALSALLGRPVRSPRHEG